MIMDYFLYYQYIVTAFLLIILINFIINNIVYKNPSNFILSKKFLKESPLVSILIPARDEEKNIGRCLRSLVKQDYGNIEILVLDIIVKVADEERFFRRISSLLSS